MFKEEQLVIAFQVVPRLFGWCTLPDWKTEFLQGKPAKYSTADMLVSEQIALSCHKVCYTKAVYYNKEGASWDVFKLLK